MMIAHNGLKDIVGDVIETSECGKTGSFMCRDFASGRLCRGHLSTA